jgi:hypothetical protein
MHKTTPPAVRHTPRGHGRNLHGGADLAKHKRPKVGRKKGKTKGPTTAEFFEEWLLSI